MDTIDFLCKMSAWVKSHDLNSLKTLQVVDQVTSCFYVTVHIKKSSTNMKRDPREHQGGSHTQLNYDMIYSACGLQCK